MQKTPESGVAMVIKATRSWKLFPETRENLASASRTNPTGCLHSCTGFVATLLQQKDLLTVFFRAENAWLCLPGSRWEQLQMSRCDIHDKKQVKQLLPAQRASCRCAQLVQLAPYALSETKHSTSFEALLAQFINTQ